jgi:hypothetical protein
MTFSAQMLTLLVIGALVLAGVALAVAVAMGRGIKPKEPSGPIPMDEGLRKILDGQAGKVQRLEQAVRVLNATDKRQQGEIDTAVRHVALLRYDAFEDVGGQLSFSCALLDDRGSGVVVTSINGRQETRVYAKPIQQTDSTFNLSTEEREAIRRAMNGAGEVVTA